MAKDHLVLTGDAELNRKLRELGGPKQKAAIRKASRAALKPVAAAAKANAPKRSGRLRKSIKVKAIKRSRSRVGSRVTTSKTDNQFKGRQFYSGFQEYGWRVGKRATNADLGVKKRKRRTSVQSEYVAAKNAARRRIKGSEFMTRAAKSHKQIALRIYREEVARFIREVAR